MGGAHHGDAAAYGDDQGRDFRGSDFGIRQLRVGFGDRSLRSAASLRAQSVGTDHSARGGDARSGGHRAAAARRSPLRDRKSTRLNSSHQIISYAVFCLKKKKKKNKNKLTCIMNKTIVKS